MYSKINESLIVTWIIQKKVIEIGHLRSYKFTSSFYKTYTHTPKFNEWESWKLLENLKTLGKKNAAIIQSPKHNKRGVIDLKYLYSNNTKESFPTNFKVR